MEGSVLSFLKAEWKVTTQDQAHWASSLFYFSFPIKLPRYNWNIVESGVKHHKPNKTISNNNENMNKLCVSILFNIWIYVIDYQEGGITKWFQLGHGTGVEVLVNLQKGHPNPRLIRKQRNSMRLPGEKKYLYN